jgi:DNA-binding transcriptional MerR regulator
MGTEYRIGAFAAMAGISAKTLRFYDQIGLLRPARIDPRTRYRWYRPEQLRELAAVMELKDAGAPLASIRGLSKTPGFESRWRQVLHDLKRANERTLEKATQSLKCINALLEQTEVGGYRTPVLIKHRQAVAIASVRARVNSYDDIDRLAKELLSALPGPALGELRGVLWHRCADSGFLEGEPFVALRQPVPRRGSYELGQLPAATLACAYSTLDDASADGTYKALSSWTRVQGYRLVGPKREISHDRVLEIQFPVAPE